MEEQNKEEPKSTGLRLTKAILEAPSSVMEMMSLPEIERRWIDTYEKTTGKMDGAMRFEAEKILFLQAISNNKKLEECDRFTQYAAFIELSYSGLTLRDGLSYILPFGKVAQWMPGWKGRLEQINEMPGVIHVHEPVVVYDCDEFVDENGMDGWKVVSHKVKRPRPADAKIILVYLIIQFNYGSRAYKMERPEVEHIRDKYSPSWKAYIKALGQKGNEGRKIGDKLLISYKDKDTQQWKSYESDDLPMWVDDEPQAFKKTLVKRTYNNLPKLPKHKKLDERIAEAFATASVEDIVDPDESRVAKISAENISEHINDDNYVDEGTGELITINEEQGDRATKEEPIAEADVVETTVNEGKAEEVVPNVSVDDLNNPNKGF